MDADSSKPLIGIVLVNYNGMKFMPDCLKSLTKITYPNAKLVIIDNASTDGSADWVEQIYPSLNLLRLQSNSGITGGNNTGIKWCLQQQCEYILLLNNDTVVMPDFLNYLVEHADNRTMTVPKIYFYDQKELINNHIGAFSYWRVIHLDWFYGMKDSPASCCVRNASMANTCALLVPRQVITDVGIMDDQFFIYFDDIDFIARAIRKRFKIKFVPNAIIYHRESSSTGGAESPLTVYYQARNRLYFCLKHNRRRPDRLIFSLSYFVVTRSIRAIQHILRGKPILARAIFRGSVDFLFGRMGFTTPSRYKA